MDPDTYGPFASLIAIAAALISAFGLLLFKAVGPARRWSWLAGDRHSFIRTAAVRAITVALIALTFITIDKDNYWLFAGGALGFGLMTFVLISWFDRVRLVHTCVVPDVAIDGTAVTDRRGRPIGQSIVIGTEDTMKPAAQKAYRKLAPISLCKFVSGYGNNQINNPAAIWDLAVLAKIAAKLTMLVTGIMLCGVMALYLAAASIDMHLSKADAVAAEDAVPG